MPIPNDTRIPVDFRGLAVPRSAEIFAQVGDVLGLPAAYGRAITKVEAGGAGFINERPPVIPPFAESYWGRRQKILCEPRKFSNFTERAYDKSHPDISSRKAGGYLGGAAEYGRLVKMIALDSAAAFKAISMGAGQTMGFNATVCGFETAEEMFATYADHEDAQILGMATFIKNNPRLVKALQRGDVAAFAEGYNGENYEANAYDRKLAQEIAQALAAEQNGAAPIDGERQMVRGVQATLNLLGATPALLVDGLMGPKTAAALKVFQINHGLQVTSRPDDRTLAALYPEIPTPAPLPALRGKKAKPAIPPAAPEGE